MFETDMNILFMRSPPQLIPKMRPLQNIAAASARRSFGPRQRNRDERSIETTTSLSAKKIEEQFAHQHCLSRSVILLGRCIIAIVYSKINTLVMRSHLILVVLSILAACVAGFDEFDFRERGTSRTGLPERILRKFACSHSTHRSLFAIFMT